MLNVFTLFESDFHGYQAKFIVESNSLAVLPILSHFRSFRSGGGVQKALDNGQNAENVKIWEPIGKL